MSSNITLEDLAKLLGNTKIAEKEKKPRKKVDRTAADIESMKARMSALRDKAKQKRDEKANYIRDGVKQIDAMEKQASLEIRKLSEKDAEELFERKYGSKIEKIDETMGTIKSSIDEMKEAKKQKAELKLKAQLLEKAEPKPMETNKLSQANNSAINIQTPTPQTNNNNTSNQQTHISHQPIPPVNSNPNRIPKIPNYRNLFRK
jgi:hypothetical protein